MRSHWLELAGGVRIESLFEGDDFCGLGEIFVGDVLLRSRQAPMRVHLSTPLGLESSRRA